MRRGEQQVLIPSQSSLTHGRLAQVTTEGGYDAAMEAPYIYAAVDALAVRAGKWAERRQRLILEASPEDLAVPSPEAAAAAAIAAVKEVHLCT